MDWIAKAQKNDTVLVDADGEEKLARLIDYPYHTKYKQMLHQYEYRPRYPNQENSSSKAKKQRKTSTNNNVNESSGS